MKKGILSLFCMALVGSISSTTSLAATNEEILKNLYDGATVPGSEMDFPLVDYEWGWVLETSNYECVRIGPNDQVSGFHEIRRVRRSISASGPLIPGKKEEKFGMFTAHYEGFEQIQPATVKGKDLVTTNPSYYIGIDDHNQDYPLAATVFIRKSDPYISFKILMDAPSTSIPKEEYYGYCYLSGASLF